MADRSSPPEIVRKPVSYVTAIIPHFFKQRRKSLLDAVRAVHTQVDEVLVWNNDSESLHLPHARVIDSPVNIGPAARFWATLTVKNPYGYVFFQDNDVLVPPGTVRSMLDWTMTYPGHVLSLHGYNVKDSYRDREFVLGVDKPTQANVTLGRAELVPMHVITRIMKGFSGVPFPKMDDLWFSSCLKQLGIKIYVVPGLICNLPGWKEGASAEEGYYDEREKVFSRLFPKEDDSAH